MAVATFISKTEFLERLGQANIEAVLGAAKQSLQIEAWLMRFNAAKDDPGIDLDFQETIDGLGQLEGAGIFSAGTADRVRGIGAPPAAPTRVRVLPPFDTAWPDVYDVLAQTDSVWTIADGVDFAPDYLEVQE